MGQLTPGGYQPMFKIGNAEYPVNRSNLKLLVGKTSTANGFSCFREAGSSTDYVVPANKTFKAIGFIAQENQGVASNITFGRGDTAPTFGGGASPTNPIYLVGGTSTNNPVFYVLASSRIEYPLIGWSVGTGKYPFVSDDSGTSSLTVFLWGYEE